MSLTVWRPTRLGLVGGKVRFAKAVADYVLAMQMEMFGLRLDKQQQDNEAIPVYKSRNTLLFASSLSSSPSSMPAVSVATEPVVKPSVR